MAGVLWVSQRVSSAVVCRPVRLTGTWQTPAACPWLPGWAVFAVDGWGARCLSRNDRCALAAVLSRVV
jgi:hypothetical protein